MSSSNGHGAGFDRALRRRSSIDVADWDGYVPVRVKSFSSTVLGGTGSHQLPNLLCAQAVGVIRIVGGRNGHKATSLWVGFSRSTDLPAPRFSLDSDEAVGEVVLPEACFSPWLEVLKSPQAYFRIGGDGGGNALASDMNFFDAVHV